MFFSFRAPGDNEYYWGVYFSPLDFAADVDRIFSSLYFERMRVPNAHGTPEEIVAHLEEERREAQTGLENVQKEMAALWEKEAPVCMQVYSQLRQKNYYFGIRKYAARYNDKFILTGWIPKQAEKSFRHLPGPDRRHRIFLRTPGSGQPSRPAGDPA